MCPQRGRQTKKSTQRRKHKRLRNEIMQPESSMDPGQISIQKLNEAREMVTITKQRRDISCWNETDIKRRLTSSKVRLSGFVPNRSVHVTKRKTCSLVE